MVLFVIVLEYTDLKPLKSRHSTHCMVLYKIKFWKVLLAVHESLQAVHEPSRAIHKA